MKLSPRSVAAIECAMRELLDESLVGEVRRDPRFVPLPWDEEVAQKSRKLKIGWQVPNEC